MGETERRRSLHWGGRKKAGQKRGSIGAEEEEEAKVGKSLVEGMDTFYTGITLNAMSWDFTFRVSNPDLF